MLEKNKTTSEEEMIFNHDLDTLYTHEFKNKEGKFLNIVTLDEETGMPNEIDINFPYPKRNRIKITLTFIKKNKDIKSVSFKKFKHYKNDGWVKVEPEQINFSYFTFKKLISFLRFLSELNLEGINERKIALSNDKFSTIDEETKKKIKTLLIQKDGPKIIEELLKSGLITSLDIVNIGYRKNQLEIFKKLLYENYLQTYKKEIIKREGIKDESALQYFFNKNQWIFGYGLDYRFHGILQKEFYASSSEADGSNEVIGDFLLGDKRFTTFVELKKPDTKIFGSAKNRSNCWKLSVDLIDALSQILEQKASGQIKMETVTMHNDQGKEIKQKAYDSKVVLVIGSWEELNDCENDLEKRIKEKTFELFRRDSRNIEIITYDELYERAKFIVHEN